MATNDARETIMRSIRTHLAASASHAPSASHDTLTASHDARGSITAFPSTAPQSPSQKAVGSVVEVFKQNLEAVDGHCIVVSNDAELEETVERITQGKRIGTSSGEFSNKDLFELEVGITYAQAGIAETGTLVLDSSVERNRLVSLVPPVHIAILDASRIYATLAETLEVLQSNGELSPAITFITGPSRTADIELTLTIGVHGPQEIHVIVKQ
jgi:L-lactate utilization protein LutC